jgi:hypothetical protein
MRMGAGFYQRVPDIDTSYDDLLDELADLYFPLNYPNHTDEAGNSTRLATRGG